MHDFDHTPPNHVPRVAFVVRFTDLLLLAARREGWHVCTLGEFLKCA